MLHNQSINSIILHFSGQPEMKLRLDGAMSNRGIMLGSILLLSSHNIHRVTNKSKIKKSFKICEII